MRTQEKIWTRMTLAFEAENPNLIRHLGAQLGSGMKAYGDQMITLFEQPAKAMNTAYFTTAAPPKVAAAGAGRYANQQPEAVLGQLGYLRSRFALSA